MRLEQLGLRRRIAEEEGPRTIESHQALKNKDPDFICAAGEDLCAFEKTRAIVERFDMGCINFLPRICTPLATCMNMPVSADSPNGDTALLILQQCAFGNRRRDGEGAWINRSAGR